MKRPITIVDYNAVFARCAASAVVMFNDAHVEPEMIMLVTLGRQAGSILGMHPLKPAIMKGIFAGEDSAEVAVGICENLVTPGSKLRNSMKSAGSRLPDIAVLISRPWHTDEGQSRRRVNNITVEMHEENYTATGQCPIVGDPSRAVIGEVLFPQPPRKNSRSLCSPNRTDAGRAATRSDLDLLFDHFASISVADFNRTGDTAPMMLVITLDDGPGKVKHTTLVNPALTQRFYASEQGRTDQAAYVAGLITPGSDLRRTLYDEGLPMPDLVIKIAIAACTLVMADSAENAIAGFVSNLPSVLTDQLEGILIEIDANGSSAGGICPIVGDPRRAEIGWLFPKND
ncbi:hypothetical protein [Caballeronia sordidicola]|uniref:Uncharacterized protein n=1 Tax=Caballeronia sordidicola TaxID=196367 RepID=A0A242MFL1_CABSO|nr:hypothetical protein [Caballeronia sordidicola]OTP69748.1 hypothetical protein PAMC26577_28930 [Caballeronia sordidicola]